MTGVLAILVMSHVTIAAGFYALGRTDELLDRSFWSFLRRTARSES
jgi:hypothetical protein